MNMLGLLVAILPALVHPIPESGFVPEPAFERADAADGTALSALLPPAALRVEYRSNPVGLDALRPRLSWQVRSDERGAMQAAYQIQVAATVDELGRETDQIWDTGRVDSDQSIHVVYEGPDVATGRRYHWRVRTWDSQGQASDWSEPAFWEMGLLHASDWEAEWIRPDLPEDITKPGPSPMLRGGFEIDGVVASARLYVSSLGLNEMEVNGQRVGELLFTPGWTSYDARLQYETYDVTDLLLSGANVLGATMGDGWYRGRMGWEDARNVYGDRLGLIAQLVLRYEDGSEEIIGTDASWKASTGPILMSDIYDGEVYDARLEKDGWSRPGYDDAEWQGVLVIDHPKEILIARRGPPVRRIQELTPVKIFRTPAGEIVADMGQNMVGWVRLRVSGSRGTTVRLRHAEVLDADGNLYTANLRSAKAALEYTLKGTDEEVYEPHFTFMGFRYVAVDGFPGELTADDLTGVVLHSDMARTGTFETSNPMVNQLQSNIAWGQKGNFLEVPTDTPARDERLGWTGDAQAFAPTAAFNFDVAAFFTRWLADLAADQKPSGSVPFVVPDVLSRGADEAGGSSGWGDVATIGPWTMYLAYADTFLLEQQYESMVDWVEFSRDRAGDDLIWDSGFHFGDWLAFATTRSDYPGATTDKDLIATAFFAHSTDLLARAAGVLGRTSESREYEVLFEAIREAFAREFVTSTGRLASNTQTAYALALQFDLLPDTLRASSGRRLAEDVREFGHLTTGFLGTPHLNDALTEMGYLDLAYSLLLRDEYPSWLYPISKGATTMWERWDGIKPDGSFQDVGMNSFNHYAYGAIGDWMYRVVAGIGIDAREPGYKHVMIGPRPGGDLTFARAELRTLYGDVASGWELEGDDLLVTVSVPPNTRATVRLPGATIGEVTESGGGLASADGVVRTSQAGDDVLVEVGSGTYEFLYEAGDLADELRGNETDTP